jgi:hypothetical protein
VVIRGDEKSGLRREAVDSQVIAALEAQEMRKNSGARLCALDSATCNSRNALGRCLASAAASIAREEANQFPAGRELQLLKSQRLLTAHYFVNHRRVYDSGAQIVEPRNQ